MFKHWVLIPALLVSLLPPTFAQLGTIDQIEKATQAQFSSAVVEFRDFLSHPNDGHYESQINDNMNWTIKAFEKRGFSTKVIITPGAPHVFAEKQFVKKAKLYSSTYR